MHALFTLKSSNAKTGPIPVTTTSRNSCSRKCPFFENGCYGEQGPLGGLWRAMSAVDAGDTFKNGRNTLKTFTWDSLCESVSALAVDTFWRHNQAGDLPGEGDIIDRTMLRALVKANRGKRGFTYTHKPLEIAENRDAIKEANDDGFTINLSANNLAHADQLIDLEIGPVVVVLPAAVSGNVKIETPAGRRVVVCPATYRDDVTCASCQLCQRQTREVVVGFPAHGGGKRAADSVATAA